MSKFMKLVCGIIAVICVMAPVGCSEPEPADENDVTAAARSLIEKAVEVNRIFFWEGLPQKEEIDGETGEKVVNLGDADYVELAEEYRYVTEDELMAKARAVYTASYCEDIKRVAFEGESVLEDQVLYPRYISDVGTMILQETWESMSTEDIATMGITDVQVKVMKINVKVAEEGLAERLPNLDTLEIVEVKHDTATVSVEFTCEGKTERQNVSMKLEDAGWRLDSPTY